MEETESGEENLEKKGKTKTKRFNSDDNLKSLDAIGQKEISASSTNIAQTVNPIIKEIKGDGRNSSHSDHYRIIDSDRVCVSRKTS